MKTTRICSLICLLCVALLTVTSLSGCGSSSSMPFNGDVTFHSISLHIDDRFIRDSTQSSDEVWIFERGYYKEYVILSKKVAANDPADYLPDYAAYMEGQGAETEIKTYLDTDAVFSTDTKDEVFCQEVFFFHNGAYYAIALRGGTEEGFAELISSVSLIQASNTSEI